MLIYLTRGLTTWAAASFLGPTSGTPFRVLCLPFSTAWGLPTWALVGDRVGFHLLSWKLMVPCSGTPESSGRTIATNENLPGQFLHSSFNHPCSKRSLIESNGWSPERRLEWNKLSNIHFMTICYMCCLVVGRRGLGIKKEIQNTSCPSGAFVIWEIGVSLSSLSAYCRVKSL